MKQRLEAGAASLATAGSAKSRRATRPTRVESTIVRERPAARASGTALPSRAVGTHWTFLTNHSLVLILLAKDATLVQREVALSIGITERAVQRVIADLEAAGIIERERVGRRNRYRIRKSQPLRHAIESHRTIGQLLTLMNGE